MEISLGKHVKLICNLEIGQTVRIDGWGYKFDGKFFKIQDVKKEENCESGFMVKIDGYENYIDSNWIHISDVSGRDIDYKQLYHELYENVAKLLVENRQHNWHPQVLLSKWDNFRK